MRSDEAAFLSTIVDRPDDDHPRLLMADWLEEQGQGERSEFIRVQVELAKRDLSACTRCGDPWNSQVRLNSFPVPLAWCARCNIEGPPRPDVDFDAVLRRRERELARKHGVRWAALPFRTRAEVEAAKRTPIGCCNRHADYLACDCLTQAGDYEFRRGFVESVTCSWADWNRHADALLAAAPIVEVTLTDRSRPLLAAELIRWPQVKKWNLSGP